jgi:hypothetical protein
MKYLLLGAILLFFLLLIYQSYETEPFVDKGPNELSLPVRSDGTCSDPDMLNMYDRFHYVAKYDKTAYPDTGCPDKYERYNFEGNSNLCLPLCPSNFTIYSSDPTYCVANYCYVAGDLSGNIRGNWDETCGPMYRTKLTLTSTLAGISSVVSSISFQYNKLSSNFTPFRTSIFNDPVNVLTTPIRDLYYPNILSNYNDIYSYQNSIQSNYLNLKSGVQPFFSFYNTFNCSNYE